MRKAILRFGAVFLTVAALLLVAHQSRQERKAIQRLTRVVEAMAARPQNDARTQLLAPQLDALDRALLTNEDLDTTPAEIIYRERRWPQVPSWPAKAADANAPHARYVDTRWDVVSTDAALAAPDIRVEPGLYPTVSVPEIFDGEGREAVYYFEFDTDRDFDSPNFWRWPALVPAAFPPDITDRHGLKFRLLATPQRDVDGRENEIRFPFRATAMRLPGWDGMTFAEMQRQARALGFALDDEAAIREIFTWVRQVYFWANDTRNRSPVGTFAAGLGECAHVNDLAGALLEMNGIPYRGVSGFDPKARAIAPDSGHSAIEVLNPETGRWGYFDPYLDILALDVQARDVGKTEFGGMVITRLPGYTMTLGDLFSYRRYFDKLGRLTNSSGHNTYELSMLQLGARQDDFGKGWPLNKAPEYDAATLWPNLIRIHVRARYAFTQGETVRHIQASGGRTPQIRLSPWGHASFTIDPRALLAAPRLSVSAAAAR